MKKIDLSVIIPTLNEEGYIGRLLDSIAQQTLKPKEIIIVDANSKDNTQLEVNMRIKSLPQIKFYRIPKYTIARQRNYGANRANTNNLLFLDADTLLQTRDVLAHYLKEVKDRRGHLAAAPIEPLSDHWKDRIFFDGLNLLHRMLRPVWPVALGINLFFEKKAFEKVGKFDEKIRVGEDLELVQRAVKSGFKFIILKNPRVHTSTRRLRKEGRVNYTIKMSKSLVTVLLYGYRKNPVKYEFGQFAPEDNPKIFG